MANEGTKAAPVLPSVSVSAVSACSACADPNCRAQLNELREFKGWDDLACHTDEDVIVEWINRFARKELRSRDYHKSYQERNKALQRFAREQLDPDELAAIRRQAERKAAERGGE
jgi:hypothetical protein